jgi:hypothetical protein
MNKTISMLLFLACTIICRAADLPVLSVYDVSPGDLLDPSPKTIFKLTNSTKKTFYILGFDIADVSHLGQTFDGKVWKDDERPGLCATGSSFYPLKPGASLLFSTWGPPKKNVPWRIRASLYEKRDPASTPVEIISPKVVLTEDPRESY